jgi:hypothetical protein
MSRAPRAGETVCGYRLLRELGSTGARRYVATNINKDKPGRSPPRVIVELFPESPTLFRNARAIAELRHPKLVPVRDVVVEGGIIAVESEYIDGEWLADLLETAWAGGLLPIAPTLRVLVDVLEGLSALHGARGAAKDPLRLVHGAVAPSNVLVGTDGVARIVHPLRTPAATPSPEVTGYVAPEVLLNDQSADIRADVFSVGVILWEILSGRRLHSGTHAGEIIVRILGGKVQLAEAPKDAPWAQPLAEVAKRALSPELGSRYATPVEMSGVIRRIAGQKLATNQDVRALVQSLAGTKIRARGLPGANPAPKVGIAAPARPAARQEAASPPLSVRPDTPTIVPPASTRAPSIETLVAPPVPPPRVRPAIDSKGGSAGEPVEIEVEIDSATSPAMARAAPPPPPIARKAPPVPKVAPRAPSSPRLSVPTPILPITAVAAYARPTAASAPEIAPLPAPAPAPVPPPTPPAVALPEPVRLEPLPIPLPVPEPTVSPVPLPPPPGAPVFAAPVREGAVFASPVPEATEPPIALTAPHVSDVPPPRSRRRGAFFLVAVVAIAVPAIIGLAWFGLARGGPDASAKPADEPDRRMATVSAAASTSEVAPPPAPLPAPPPVLAEPAPAALSPVPAPVTESAPSTPPLEAAPSKAPGAVPIPSASNEAVAPPPLNKKSKSKYYPLGI